MVPARRRAGWLLIALLLLAGKSALADFDIDIAAGTGIDWFQEVPRKTPTLAVRIPAGPARATTPGGPPAAEGTTYSRELLREKPASSPVSVCELGPTTAMDYTRIQFGDGLEQHWFVRRPQVPLKDILRHDADEMPFDYPPPVSDDIFWLSGAPIVRRIAHPNWLSNAEVLEHLVLMGEGGRVCCEAADPIVPAAVKSPPPGVAALAADWFPPTFKFWWEEVRKQVLALPNKKPRPLEGKTAEEGMLLRVAAEDLAQGYAYGFAPGFADRLLALEPDETVPLLARYLDPKAHLLLRRNACALLGCYEGAPVTSALLTALQDEDGCVKERAALELARRREKRVLPYLEKAFSQQGLRRPCALGSMGLVGDESSSATILKAIAEEREDPEVLWSAIPAAARCAHPKPQEALAALNQLARILEHAGEGSFEERQCPIPLVSTTDEPLLKAAILLEMTLCARARLGDAGARQRIEKILGATPGAAPVKRAKNAPADAIGTFHAPTFMLLVETLPSLGDSGKERLQAFAKDKNCEFLLRLKALDGLVAMNGLTSDLLVPLTQDKSPAVRSRALRLLATVDAARSREAALALLSAKGSVPFTDLVASLQVLSKDGKVDVKLLTRLLKDCVKISFKYELHDPVTGNATVSGHPPVVEELLKALGDAGDDAAIKPLLDHAKNKATPVRAAAVAALGGYFPQTATQLIDFLGDDDGWVRYTAYRVLHRKVPDLDATTDWIYGAAEDIRPVWLKWKERVKTLAAAEAADRPDQLVRDALAAFAAREKNGAAWERAKAAVKEGGVPTLRLLLAQTSDKAKKASAFGVLRAVTGEPIPDDQDAWKAYIDSKK